MILGLDASRITIGWTLLEDSGSIIDAGLIDLSKEDSLLNKYDIMFTSFQLIHIKYNNISYVSIEDFTKKFVGGQSTISTIIRLAQSNVLCQLAVRNIFNIAPSLINVSTARKTVVGKIPNDLGGKKKEYVFNWFLEKYPHYKSFLPQKTNKKTGEISILKKSYDIVDSFIIASYQYITNNALNCK